MTEKLSKTILSCLVTFFWVFAANAAAQEDMFAGIHPQGLKLAGVYSLREIEPDLTGTGVKYAVISRSYTYIGKQPQNNYRPYVEHNSLNSEHFNFYDQALLPADISPHTTAICSILFGRDAEAYNPAVGNFYYEGAAPDAEADIYEFIHFLFNNISTQTPPDADILTADFGRQFEDYLTRGIESFAEQYGILVIAGIGNGTDARDPVLYPAAGANAIGVGVVDSVKADSDITSLEHFALASPEHSSAGPTANGRCKPDIIAPGNCLAAVSGKVDEYEPTGNYCSFSTPVVAGIVGLLVQKAKNDPQLSMAAATEGGNCVIKAILMNSATKLPYWHKGQLPFDDDHTVPLDYVQGAGMVNAVGAYQNLITGQQGPGDVYITGWDNNNLYTSPAKIYRFQLAEPENKQITITLNWNRHYESSYPYNSLPEKDSNLRLELWAVDLQNPANNILLDYSDSLVDNVEHIYTTANPDYETYEIVVSNSSEAVSVPVSQQYGLAWNVSEQQQQDSLLWYDLNFDGIVDDYDFAYMLMNTMAGAESPDSYILGDINLDGVININDVSIFLQQDKRRTDWYQDKNRTVQ